MGIRKKMTIIILIVAFIAFVIQLTRADLIISLNKNKNIEFIDLNDVSKNKIDDEVLKNLTSEKYLIVYDANLEGFSRIKYNFEKCLTTQKKNIM